MHNATGQMTPPPRVASTEYFRMDDDGDVLAARPTPLVEVRPQLGVLRHSGAHIVDFSPFVQILDDPVPQMGEEHVVEFMRNLDARALDEQVIAVPKISLDRVSKRCPRPRTRRADRLVEVPTIISYSSLQQRTSEQIIDIPVPQGRGGRGGLGGLQGVSRVRVQQRSVEQITLTFQSLMVVVFKVSSQDRVQRLRPLLRTCVLVPWMSVSRGFSHFSPYEEWCGVGSALGGRKIL